MSAGLLHGLWTALLLAAFLAIVGWAWSGRRRRDFEEAARLPLDDDAPSHEERPARVASDAAVAPTSPGMEPRLRGDGGGRAKRRPSPFTRRREAAPHHSPGAFPGERRAGDG